MADQGLSFLLKQSPALEVLDINHCQQLTGTSIRQLSEVPVRILAISTSVPVRILAISTSVPVRILVISTSVPARILDISTSVPARILDISTSIPVRILDISVFVIYVARPTKRLIPFLG